MLTFDPKPIPIFPSYRPMYRITQILLVLKLNCLGNKSSLLKLHFFSWGFKSESNLEELKNFAVNKVINKISFFGIEPSLNRALDFAVGENLIGFDGSRYFLKTKGDDFVKIILEDEELFTYEKQVLKLIDKKITEKRISQLETEWKNA